MQKCTALRINRFEYIQYGFFPQGPFVLYRVSYIIYGIYDIYTKLAWGLCSVLHVFQIFKILSGWVKQNLCLTCFKQGTWWRWILLFDSQIQRRYTLPDYPHAVYHKSPHGDLIWQVVFLQWNRQESREHILFARHCPIAPIISDLSYAARGFIYLCSPWGAVQGESSTNTARVTASTPTACHSYYFG